MANKSKITITIDDNLLKKLRAYRAKKVKENLNGISFSQVIEDLTKTGLKAAKKQGLKVISQIIALSGIIGGICITHGIGHSFHAIESLI